MLNKKLKIGIKLLTAFHSQTDRQTDRTNQELEQYLRVYIDYRQENQSEWLVTAEFAFNNKVYIVIKLSPSQVEYKWELRIGFEIRKEKNTKVEEFVKEIKKMHEKVKVVLKRSQEEIKNMWTEIRKKQQSTKQEIKYS